MFTDREAAGTQLASLLGGRVFDRPIVLALPRGGVPVGAEIARRLKCPFDLLIVDWHLPDTTGPEVVRWVRKNVGTQLPILFVTHRQEERDIVEGLGSGADDFMVKPVRIGELSARVSALLRRAYPSEEQKQLSFPPFEIDVQRGEVRKGGAKLELTPKEFELTVTLFRNIGRLLSRGHLQETVWGRSGDLATRTVDTHVSQVRKKLDLRPESGYRVVPIYNYGYRHERLEAPK